MITTVGGCVQLTCVLDTKDEDISAAETWLQKCADKINDEVAITMSNLTLYGTASIYLGNYNEKKFRG